MLRTETVLHKCCMYLLFDRIYFPLGCLVIVLEDGGRSLTDAVFIFHTNSTVVLSTTQPRTKLLSRLGRGWGLEYMELCLT